MRDTEEPPRRALCFLSTLLSQKHPEKSDIVLRCIVSGQPKPEVTWYKNGQAISEYDISCYEFFEHQYIHMLHLHSCTKHDAAVYQITAKNHSGMICCSAHIEVECSSENPQLPPNRKDDVDTGWKHETEIYEAESARQMDEKGHPYKEEERISLGTPLSADSSLPKSNRSGSLQLLASDDMHISSSEKPLDVKGTRKSQAVYDPNHTEELAEGSLLHNSSNTPNTQDVDWHQTMHSKVSWPMDGALNHEDPDDEDLNPSHQYPKVQKYISSSRPLSQAAGPVYPGSSAPVNKQVFAQVSSEDSDSDYELCPEITLTYTEEFSDDDLEYLECSDVMTDYSNAVWQRHLQGTDCVFLLESDDEELEFSECCLGGCGHFLSEMGYWSQVSDNTEPMDVTPGFWGFRSQRQEVEVRSSQASTDSPSSLQPGMTLTLGPHQDGTLTVTDQGRYKLPTASGAAENGYPGIQGETRDCRQAEEEAASDNLLNMDKAPTERKPGELEKSGTHQSLGTAAERRAGGKDLLSTEGSQKPVRVRRPGIKGKPKKRNAHLKESATEDTFNLLYPGQPANHPLTQSDQTESSWARAEATDLNLQFHAEECAISPRIEQQAETLQTPTDSLPRGGDRNATGAEWWLNTPCEASQVPGQSEPPQVRIQQTVGERGCLSQTPASAGPVEAETPLTGTNGSSLPNSGGIHKDNASLAQYLEVESWTQSPQHEEKQDLDKGHNAPGGPWGDQELEWGIAEAEGGYVFPCEFSEPYPQDGHADLIEPKAPSVASPGLRNTILTMENMFDGPGSREGVSGMERFEAGDHGTCCDTMGSAPVGKYLPQEICSMDPELADGQGKASDLCPPDDTKLEVLLNAQSSDSPRSTCENGKDRSQAGPSLFVSTFTWAISQGACEGTSGGSVAEVESSTSVAACRRTDQGRPLPSHTGGLEERQPPSSENNAFLQVKEEDEETKDTTDIPPKPSSMVTFPQEKPTMLTEGLQVTRESEDTSAMTMAAKVYPTKYLAASIAENNQADGTEENSPQAPEETVFQLPASVPWGHILNGSTAESIKEIPCMVPRAPETHAHVLQLSEGEKFCSNFLLQIGNQSTDKSQMVDRADHRTLQENFQEKGSETKKKFHSESSPHQSSLSEDSFQESLPSTSAVQEEICLTPLDHSPRNFKEKRGQSSGLGTSISMVAEGTVEDDSQALSNVLPLSNYLPEDSTESGPGSGEPGNKLKIITLEASVSEIWPPRQPTDSKYKESEAVPIIPGRIWALSEVLKADASVCELDLTETAVPASSPQCESHSTLVHNREIHGYQEPVSSDDGRSLSSQHLSQLRPLESSVDPIDDKESCTTNSLSEASKTREKKNINKMSQTQEETQLKVDQPAFFKQLLTHPQILESSVDPIDETGVMEWARAEQPEPPRSTPGLTKEGSQPKDGNLGQQVEVQSAIWHVPYPEGSGETIPSEKNINQNQGDSERGQAEQSQNAKAKGEVQPATLQVPRPDKGGEIIPSECNTHQVQVDSERSFGEAVQSKHNKAEVTSPTPPPSSCLAIMTHATVGVETDATDQIHDVTANDIAKQRNHQYVFSDSKERGKNIDDKCANHLPSSSGLLPPEGSSTNFSTSNKIEEAKTEELQTEETKPLNSPGSPATTWAFISGDCVSENAPKSLHDPCQQGTVGSMKKFREEETAGPMVTKPGKFPEAQPAVTGSEEAKKKQENSGSGRIAEGVKKKILSRVAALRLRLEEKENVRKASSFRGKIPKLEPLVSRSEKKDQKEPPCRRGGKAPVLLRKIQAEMVPDRPGNVKLSCQFAEIHEDSTIWWTKDSESIAQVQRSAGDHSTVSLAIVQASQKDQGFYHCCIKNSYGKVTAEFNLTAEVLAQLSSHQDVKGCEEIEFSQLIFKDDFLNDSYFGGSLRGQIATEELHFGEGVHRKAFRSTVMQGLMPVFEPGHACVLKVHNAIAYGTRNNDELIQRNYKLAAQECYVQNTARYYAKIYAAEAQPLEGFGEVPEIIPIFLIHRPENNIPYATVEEELIGEFVKYSIRDGKEINFLRRESEAGQKCCTFQHWVYQKTSGSLLVTDMQGVGMKLTDVGIATLAKGYKGFKGNCSMTFIDQFKALHQCNKYCKMLGLKSLQSNNQKHKKPSVVGKSKVSRTPQQ